MPASFGLPTFRYQAVAAGPSPEDLAARLKESAAVRAAARRLDDLDRLRHQQTDSFRGKLRLGIGALGLVLGTAPAIPGTIKACPSDPVWMCGLRIGAIIGSCLALGVSLWSGWELSRHALHFEEEVAKMDAELRRTLQSRGTATPPEEVFSTYRRWTHNQRAAFRAQLHEAAQEPKRSFAGVARTVMGV